VFLNGGTSIPGEGFYAVNTDAAKDIARSIGLESQGKVGITWVEVAGPSGFAGSYLLLAFNTSSPTTLELQQDGEAAFLPGTVLGTIQDGDVEPLQSGPFLSTITGAQGYIVSNRPLTFGYRWQTVSLCFS